MTFSQMTVSQKVKVAGEWAGLRMGNWLNHHKTSYNNLAIIFNVRCLYWKRQTLIGLTFLLIKLSCTNYDYVQFIGSFVNTSTSVWFSWPPYHCPTFNLNYLVFCLGWTEKSSTWFKEGTQPSPIHPGVSLIKLFYSSVMLRINRLGVSFSLV
jgi:hypothetical protein